MMTLLPLQPRFQGVSSVLADEARQRIAQDLDTLIRQTEEQQLHFQKTTDLKAALQGVSEFWEKTVTAHKAHWLKLSENIPPVKQPIAHLVHILNNRAQGLFNDLTLLAFPPTNPEQRRTRVNNRLSYLQKLFRHYHHFLKTDLAGQPNSLTQLFNQVIQAHMPDIEQKQITLRVKGLNSPALEGLDTIMAKDSLYLVLENLLQNAIKYTPQGGEITIRTCLLSSHPEKRSVGISIKDSGIGIPPEEVEKVLRGNRATNALASGIHGTGFGLQQVNKMLGGHLRIKSPVKPNRSFPGTEVRFLLRLSNKPSR